MSNPLPSHWSIKAFTAHQAHQNIKMPIFQSFFFGTFHDKIIINLTKDRSIWNKIYLITFITKKLWKNRWLTLWKYENLPSTRKVMIDAIWIEGGIIIHHGLHLLSFLLTYNDFISQWGWFYAHVNGIQRGRIVYCSRKGRELIMIEVDC